MSADASLLTLPASSNNDDCKNFVAALGAAKGGPVYVDASQCTQMTARFAQLLVLASRAWSVESLSLRRKWGGMSLNILAIDDSRTIRELLKHALGNAGFQVTTADDGVDSICRAWMGSALSKRSAQVIPILAFRYWFLRLKAVMI